MFIKSKFFVSLALLLSFILIIFIILSQPVNLFPVQIKEPNDENFKYGFMDKTGKIVIEPKYDYVTDFSEGLAGVKLYWKCGYIDKNNKFVIELPKCDGVEGFKGGLAKIFINGKQGYINKQGKYIVKPEYISLGEYSEGLVDFQIGDKIGYIDEKGKIAIKPYPTWTKLQTDMWYDIQFKDELAVAYDKASNSYGFIDKKGNYVIKPSFKWLCHFSENLALAMVANDKYGYIDKTGKFVIKPEIPVSDSIYACYGTFSEGLAAKLVKNKWGYIDKTGKLIIEAKYDSIPGMYDFANGFKNSVAIVMVNGKYGLINNEGKYILPPEYDQLNEFSDGLAFALNQTKSGYIDQSGRFIIKFNIPCAFNGNFKNGLAEIRINDKFGYINKKGDFIAPQKSFSSNYTNSANNYEADVYTLCQNAVKNNLNYPRTAKFPWGYSGYISKSSDGIYTLNRYVDAQNSFGTEQRTYFTCEARISGDRVILVDLDMDY